MHEQKTWGDVLQTGENRSFLYVRWYLLWLVGTTLLVPEEASRGKPSQASVLK